MVTVGTTGTVEVGACIMIPGCILVGAITILGIPVIMAMDTVVGTILGGVMAATGAATAATMAIMETITATVAVGDITMVMELLGVTLIPETDMYCPTTNAISSPMWVAVT